MWLTQKTNLVSLYRDFNNNGVGFEDTDQLTDRKMFYLPQTFYIAVVATAKRYQK